MSLSLCPLENRNNVEIEKSAKPYSQIAERIYWIAMSAQDINLGFYRAGEAVREYLTVQPLGYPYEFYQIWRQFKKRTSYSSARRLFGYLRRAGLIRAVRYENHEKHWPRHLHELNPELIDSPFWWNVEKAVKQQTSTKKL